MSTREQIIMERKATNIPPKRQRITPLNQFTRNQAHESALAAELAFFILQAKLARRERG